MCFLLSVGSNVGTKPFWGFECQHLLPLISTLICMCGSQGLAPSHSFRFFVLCDEQQSAVGLPRGLHFLALRAFAFYKYVSWVWFCVAGRRSFLLDLQVDIISWTFAAPKKSISIMALTSPNICFCVPKSQGLRRGRPSQKNRKHTCICIGLTAVTYLPVSLFCPWVSFMTNSCNPRAERFQNE